MEQVIRDNTFGLRENLAIIFRNKRTILAVLISTVLISLIGSFLVSKVYEANARILIQNYREASIVSASSLPSNPTILNSSKDKLLSEIEIFKSSSVVGKTVDHFSPETVLDEMHWRWDWLGELPGKIRTTVFEGLWIFAPTKMLFNLLGLKEPVDKNKRLEAIRKITKHLSVEPIKGTNVFIVVFESPDGEFSALLVNSLIESYQDYHLYLRQGRGGAQLFTQEVDLLRNELRTAKKELLVLKHSSGIISVKPQIQNLLEKLNKTQAAIEQAEVESTEALLRIEETERQLQEQPKVIRLENSRTRNPILDTLTDQLAKLEIEKDLYVDYSASALRLNDEITRLKQRIAREKNSVHGSERSGINLVYQELQKDLRTEKKKVQSLKHTANELNKQKQQDEKRLEQFDNEKMLIYEMELDIEVKEQALRLFSKKQEEVRINTMLNDKKISDVAPVELAVVPESAVSPSKIKNLIIGIITGLAGGILIAYLSEYFRRSLSTKEEVEEVLGRPCLAAFRLLDGENDSEAKAYNLSQLRHLDEAVRQLNRLQNIQSIFIASSIEGEGKSKVAHMLAQSLTAKNSRVLLVDNLFIDQAQVAYSNVPIAKELTIKFKSLSEPNNPDLIHIRGEALTTTKKQKPSMRNFMQLIEPIKKKFDYIIIDGPAQSTVPESLSLAAQMDSVIFVVEADKTSSITIAKTLRIFKNADARVHGVVLNKRCFTIPDWVYDWFLLTVKPYK